jgi:tetrathionate reductase subunit B
MKDKSYAMAVDLERCTGCHACTVACKAENEVLLGFFRTKVYYYDQGTFPQVRRHFLPVLCNQCDDAPCIPSCPTASLAKRADGIVRVNQSTCEACGECVKACPYGALYIDPKRHVADKCDFCSHRLDAGMEPACVQTCPSETLIFGDLNDPQSRISRWKAEHGAELTVLKPEKESQPRVFYRGLVRDMERKVPDGRPHDPRSYEIDTWARLDAVPQPFAAAPDTRPLVPASGRKECKP